MKHFFANPWSPQSPLFAMLISALVAGPALADEPEPIQLFPTYDQLEEWGMLGTGPNEDPGPADPEHISHPGWLEAIVARVHYSYRGDQRRGAQDHETFQTNPDGIITGRDLHRLIRPVDPEVFKRTMRARGETEDLDRKYREYQERVSKQGLAVLALNRIIDEEMMKLRIDPRAIPPERVDYVVRAVTMQNAISRELVPVREVPAGDGSGRTRKVTANDESMRPTGQLYGWLLDMYEEARQREEEAGRPKPPIAFNMDWTFNDHSIRDQYRPIRNQPWPRVRLEFPDGLPPELYQFERAIEEKLFPVYRRMLRQQVWAAMMRKHAWRYFMRVNPSPGMRMRVVDMGEMEDLYDVLKEQFQIQDMEADIHDITVAGETAERFLESFNEKLEARQATLLEELFGSEGRRAERSEEEREELKSRIVEHRGSVPPQVLRETMREFSSEIEAGRLSVSITAATLHHNGDDEPASDGSLESRRKRVVFNPVFSAMKLFPRYDQEVDGETRILFLKETRTGETRYVGMDDPRVDQALMRQLEQRDEAAAIRKTAYELLRRHRVEIGANLCVDPSWPCVEFDADEWVNLLFPEQLFPGEDLGEYGPGRPVPSTLREPGLVGKVMRIKTDLFMKAFELENGPEGGSVPVSSR